MLLGYLQCCSQRSLLGSQNYHSLLLKQISANRGHLPIATKTLTIALHTTARIFCV